MNESVNILLVEDNPGDAGLIKLKLKESTFSDSVIFVAESLAEAITFKEKNILLLLIDLGLPDSDGIDTVRGIRKHYPDSAIIVLTGLDDEKIALETLRAGAQNYLTKSEIDHKILDKSIRFSLERHHITQKLRETDKELTQSKFFLEKAQEVAHMGSWVVDLEMDTAVWSDETKRIFGFNPGEFDSKPYTFFSMIHPQDLDLLNFEISKAAAEKKVFEYTHRIIRKDDVMRWVCSEAEIEVDENGKVSKMIGSVQDITEKREAQEKIKKTNEQLRQLTNHLQQVREEERRRIGREIHDDLGQQLTAIKMDVAWIDKHIAEEDAPLKNKLKNVISLLDASNMAIRRILTELRAVVLDEKGLLEAIEVLGNQFTGNTGIPFQLNFSENEIQLPEASSICIFRIFQEALTNITRYAHAKSVSASLLATNEFLNISIEDDGKGFDTAAIQDQKSFGILGMKERVHSLNGKFNLVSSIGNGTKIKFSLPFNNFYKP